MTFLLFLSIVLGETNRSGVILTMLESFDGWVERLDIKLFSLRYSLVSSYFLGQERQMCMTTACLLHLLLQSKVFWWRCASR